MELEIRKQSTIDRKSLKRALCIFMSMLMIFTSLSGAMQVFAAEVQSTLSSTNGNVTDGNVTDGNITEYEIEVGQTINVNIRANKITYIKFVPKKTGTYIFTSASEQDTYGYLYDENKNVLANNDDDGDSGNFRIEYELTGGETYYWGVRYYNSGKSGNFDICLENTCEHSGEWKTDVNATCTEDGRKSFTCTECEAYFTEIIPAGHSYGNDNVCDVCGYTSELIAEGDCGDNLTWTLYNNNILYITGNGAMTDFEEPSYDDGYGECNDSDYDYDDGYGECNDGYGECNDGYGECNDDYDAYTETTAPWYAYRSRINNVQIANGVTSIGSYAFYNCDNLVSIEIPNSVAVIGSFAFYNCKDLTSIDLPNGLTSIDDYAFYNCLSLTSIAFPAELTSIGVYAFHHCEGLTNIELPDSITSIGDYAFEYCHNLTSIELPDGLTSIGNYTFEYCYSLTNIDLPDGLTSIGNYTFYSCDSLTNIDLPDGLTSIGNYTFDYCYSLTNIDLPDGLTSIGAYAFSSCDSLTSIDLPDGLTSIGDSAFALCYSLTSIDLPDGITSIGNSAFYSCQNLTHIDLPDGLISIGDYAFYGCHNLTSIDLPDGITSIGDGAFRACDSLTSIDLPDGITSIGDSAFYGCSSLTSIDLPDRLTSIGDDAFYGCSSLTSIDLPDGLTSIGNWAFEYCSSLTSIDLPYSVTNIGISVFIACNNLERITIRNPKCNIYDSYITIPSGATIYGYENSTAEAYAEKYHRSFVSLGCAHTPGTILEEIPASCTTGGLKTYICGLCGERISEVIPANGHTESAWIVDIEATCTAEGSKHTECTVCEETLQTADIEKLAHSYTAVVTAPTCTEQGYTTYTCECGDSYEGEYTDIIPHTDSDEDEICDNCDRDVPTEDATGCECRCHSSGFMKFIWRIISYFQKLFRVNQYCSCGEVHW